MAEYINREEINRISFTDAVLIDGEVRIEKIALVRDIEKLPAADVAPVRHGQVETVTDRFMVMHQRCSECDAELEWKAYPNYCPNCGAKMDGERKENENV